MRYVLLALALVASLVTSTVPASSAADITGTWQGIMAAPDGSKVHRVMVITKTNGTYDVAVHSPDESEVPIVTRNVSVKGSNVVMTFNMNSDPWLDYHRIYRAKLSTDGNAIEGTWEGTGVKIAMNFHRTGPVTLHQLAPKRDLFVTVDTGVKDEVLDWGGTGRPVMLLAGQGVTARGFRSIVPALLEHYHVFSITRRGYGNSSKPPVTVANYNAKHLGQDVLAIIDTLNIDKPVLIGHSLAGEELSYVGVNAPQKVAGLIYLDAAYWYAYDTGVPQPPLPTPPPGAGPTPPLDDAIDKGFQRFHGPIDVPILAIYANPHAWPPGVPKDKVFDSYVSKQIAAFKRDLPSAKVIVIPNANHFVYMSNTKEVLREINTFIGTLPM